MMRFVLRFSTTQPSLLQENVEYLTLPIHLASTVMFVGHVRALQILDAALDALKKTDKPMVGLDAEWSAYTGYSKSVCFIASLCSVLF